MSLLKCSYLVTEVCVPTIPPEYSLHSTCQWLLFVSWHWVTTLGLCTTVWQPGTNQISAFRIVWSNQSCLPWVSWAWEVDHSIWPVQSQQSWHNPCLSSEGWTPWYHGGQWSWNGGSGDHGTLASWCTWPTANQNSVFQMSRQPIRTHITKHANLRLQHHKKLCHWAASQGFVDLQSRLGYLFRKFIDDLYSGFWSQIFLRINLKWNI